jgi:hypothetical protein
MQLDRLDLVSPAVPETVPAATDGQLDEPTREALIKLLGRAIELVGLEQARVLAPRLVAYLTAPPRMA